MNGYWKLLTDEEGSFWVWKKEKIMSRKLYLVK